MSIPAFICPFFAYLQYYFCNSIKILLFYGNTGGFSSSFTLLCMVVSALFLRTNHIINIFSTFTKLKGILLTILSQYDIFFY